MKIIEINIKGYGPVVEFSFHPEQMTCIYGVNESGKTAIVEVLAYALFKRTIAHLRYNKPKSIHIVVDDHGRKVTLPSRKSAQSLPTSDIADLLYVHASQTPLYSDGTKDRFWDGLKTVLSGMEAGITYAKLDEKIFTSVGLQPKKEQWKQEKQEQIDHDIARKKALSDYISKISDIEQIQTKRQYLEKEKSMVEKECAAIDAWIKYKKYKELSRLYDTYREKATQLQNYERYKPELLEHWQELDLKKKTHLKDDAKLQAIDQEIVELGREKMDLQRKQDFIEAWEMKTSIVAGDHPRKRTRTLIPYIITAVVALAFVLSLFTAIPTIAALIALVLSTGVSGFYLYRTRISHRQDMRHSQIMEKAKRIFPDIATIADLNAAIKYTQEEMIRVATLLVEKNETKKHLADKESSIHIERELAEVRNKTGLAELQDFKNKINKKKNLEAERNELYGKIFGFLGEKNESSWERMIEKLKESAPSETPDVAKETNLRKSLVDLDKQLQTLDKQISVFKEVQKTTYGIDDPRSAFIEYDRLKKKLSEYDMEKKAALTAREIFKDMSMEQDDYIHDVISGSHSLTEYFKIITDNYDTVTIKNNDFVVSDEHGHEYQIDALSSGTKDQLLICFRLAALTKAYPRGVFIILDDAFIFADWPRRKKLMELLKAFIQDGNQVIYFTSDDHTRDLFAEYGAQIKDLS